MRNRLLEISVGIFMLMGLFALFVLAFKVSGLVRFSQGEHYVVTAEFDNIGSLKARAPVRVAGVRIGQVHSINLDNKSFKAVVTLWLDKSQTNIPADSSAKILTEGILGANYIALTPGFEDLMLHDGDHIDDTHPAMILENMVGQLLFKVKGDKKNQDDEKEKKKSSAHNDLNQTNLVGA